MRSIMNVDLNKVDREHLKTVLASCKVKFPEAAENSVLVGKLAAYYKTNPPGSLVECTECGGASDEELPVCPYCNTGDESPSSEAPAPLVGEDDDTASDDTTSVEPDNEDEPDEE